MAGGGRTGNINNTDCDTSQSEGVFSVRIGALAGGQFEGWRIRVEETTTVTITTSANFDTTLDIYRIPDLTDPSSASFLSFDDDSGPGSDAELQSTLSPNTEYWIFVSGFDESETGLYTLTVSQQAVT